MSTETTTEPANELLSLIENSKVEISTAKSLQAAFEGAFTQAKEWNEKAKTIVVTDASQLKEMKLARESRLLLRKVRTDVENKRKELKADALNYGRAVDGIASYLKDLIEPTEAYLLEQEEFAKRIEAQRIEEMKQARIAELLPYGVSTEFIDLAGMPEPVYQKLLADSKTAHEALQESNRKAAEAAQKAEQERLAAEKAEAERLELQRLENERLKREADEQKAKIEAERREMEAKLVEERRLAKLAQEEAEKKAEYERQVAEQRIREEQAKAKAERDALEARSKAEQAKRDAAIKAQQEAEAKKQHEERMKLEAAAAEERALREKLEREAKSKADAEAAKKKAEEAAAKKAAKAPDKTKLANFANHIRGLTAPVLTTEEGKAMQTLITDQITKFAAWVDAQAAKL